MLLNYMKYFPFEVELIIDQFSVNCYPTYAEYSTLNIGNKDFEVTINTNELIVVINSVLRNHQKTQRNRIVKCQIKC